MSKQKQWLGVRAKQAKPTRHHRPAVWEVMLGTVAAASPDGEVRNFDYDWDGAKQFAQVATAADIRLCRYQQSWQSNHSWPYKPEYLKPSKRQMVLFVETERV